MRQSAGCLGVRTSGPGLNEITREVRDWAESKGMARGLLTLFCRHTSASLIIQENAAPDVRADLIDFFKRLVPEDGKLYRHDDEGPDDMPAHIRAALTQTQLSIPIESGRLMLGTWQGVYLFEHRHQPQMREVALHLIGE
ncbi:MAG TPA: secondary thiamine-phosphate synthase enzyme YjbQ [Stellaceae bacterium]|jgi:secondary thiamine-phosphate synthase enzyme|nr:secondary thiamine-phosphate synthase enzyme YjbQ [Stellaceae bacterium]